MQFKFFTLAALLGTVSAFPNIHPAEFRRLVQEAANPANSPEIRDGQVGRVVQFDPVPAFTGTKKIPGNEMYALLVDALLIFTLDDDHPFIAPGPNDLRGPCRKFFSSPFADYFTNLCE